MTMRKTFSGKRRTNQIPRKAPMAIAGIINTSTRNEAAVMVFHDQMCNGTLERFTMKKNQAPVPM